VSHEIELKPGAAYRLRARLRTDQESAKASLMVQFYLPPKDGSRHSGQLAGGGKSRQRVQDFEFRLQHSCQGRKGLAREDAELPRAPRLAREKGSLFGPT